MHVVLLADIVCLCNLQFSLKTSEFAAVFDGKKHVNANSIKLYFLKSDASAYKLGLIVSKKIHKHANKRNYMKRVLRDHIRCNKQFFYRYSLVLVVKKYFDHSLYHAIQSELAQITSDFCQKIEHT